MWQFKVKTYLNHWRYQKCMAYVNHMNFECKNISCIKDVYSQDRLLCQWHGSHQMTVQNNAFENASWLGLFCLFAELNQVNYTIAQEHDAQGW